MKLYNEEGDIKNPLREQLKNFDTYVEQDKSSIEYIFPSDQISGCFSYVIMGTQEIDIDKIISENSLRKKIKTKRPLYAMEFFAYTKNKDIAIYKQTTITSKTNIYWYTADPKDPSWGLYFQKINDKVMIMAMSQEFDKMIPKKMKNLFDALSDEEETIIFKN